MFTDPRSPAPGEAAPRKFMFDHSFAGSNAANKPVERKPVLMKPEQIDALKQESYNEGFAAGQKAGVEQQTLQLMNSIAFIDQRMVTLMDAMQAEQGKLKAGIHTLVLAVARKILPDFSAKHGLQEIYAMLTSAIAEMVQEPRLVVRTHDSEFDAINNRIHEITVQKAYAGKVVVLADADIAPGDCRVEWADGGIERSVEATWQAVENVITPEIHS